MNASAIGEATLGDEFIALLQLCKGSCIRDTAAQIDFQRALVKKPLIYALSMHIVASQKVFFRKLFGPENYYKLISLMSSLKLRKYSLCPADMMLVGEFGYLTLEQSEVKENTHREMVRHLSDIEKISCSMPIRARYFDVEQIRLAVAAASATMKSQPNLPWPEWLWSKIADLFIYFGDFTNYLYCRNKMKTQMLRAGNSGSKFKALVETGEIEAKKFALNIQDKAYFDMMTGDISTMAALRRPFTRRLDEEFRMLVESKSIAIVGPAAMNCKNGDEIDSFDLVYRINFPLDRISDSESKINGSRTDILFLNSKVGGSFGENQKKYHRNIFMVCKVKGHPKEIMKTHRARHVIRNNYFLRDAPNSIQYILYDILLFKPRSVKLFNVNLYASGVPYNTIYASNRQKFINSLSKFEYNRLFLNHDVVSNFYFTKVLYNLNYLAADDDTSRVLGLDCPQYVEQLALLYPDLYGRMPS
jgi:hypothetical protein